MMQARALKELKSMYGEVKKFRDSNDELEIVGITVDGEKLLVKKVGCDRVFDYYVTGNWTIIDPAPKPKYPIRYTGAGMDEILKSLGGCRKLYTNDDELQSYKFEIVYIEDKGPNAKDVQGRYELRFDSGMWPGDSMWLGENQIGPGRCGPYREYLFDKPHALTDIEKKIILAKHGSLIIDCGGEMLDVIGIGFESFNGEYTSDCYATSNECFSKFRSVNESNSDHWHKWFNPAPLVEAGTYDDPDDNNSRAKINKLLIKFRGKKTKITFTEIQ
jgi:hypothetical protein